MRAFILYTCFFTFLFTSVSQLHAQTGSSSWLDSAILRIETRDTVGLQAEINSPSDASTSNEYKLRKQGAHCYFTYFFELEPQYSDIANCLHLDSLVHNDTLHLFTGFLQGYYYYATFNYPIATHFLNEVALASNNKANSLMEARCFLLRALMFETQGYPDESDAALLVALDYYKREKYAIKVAALYNNLALNSNLRNDSASAFRYSYMAIAVRDSIHDLIGLGQSYNNLGTIYLSLDHPDSALYYFRKGLEYRITGNAPDRGKLESRINIGKALYGTHDTLAAIDTLEKCYAEATERKHYELLRRTTDILRTIYFDVGDYKRAYEVQSVYYAMVDTIYNRSKKEDLLRLGVEYDFRAREKEAAIRQQEKEERDGLIMVSLGVGLILAGIIVYSLYRSNKSKKKSNEIITTQRDVLDKKQQEITESIRYARFIQQALLPLDQVLREQLGSHFVFYMPKDIVSGDFYWLQPESSGWLAAVADCTGHGVPGAFMSLLAKENLDKAAASEQSPGLILGSLNRAIKKSLQQGESGHAGLTLQDGLDAALIRKKGSEIIYAGANRPLWLYRSASQTIEDVKPDKRSIGGTTPDDFTFGEKIIGVNEGDILYLFTDGFPDQFGGSEKKKLTTRKFRSLLLSIATLPMEEQKDKLKAFLSEWRGNEEQVDDILLVGIKC